MVRFQGVLGRWLFSVVMMLLLVQPTWAVTIKVQSDRNPVAMNESFRLTFEADGAVDDNPDFKPLEQAFEILNRSQSTSMQIINGQISQARQWTVTLMPQRSGRLTAPPISFGDDKSPPLVIEVTEVSAVTAAVNKSELFIEVSIESGIESESEAGSGTVYVQSQLIYKVRLLRAINVANARLSEPQISDVDAVIEKLGDDREFETTRNERRYIVLERSYAIFPQQSGRLTIAPVTFEGQLVSRARGVFGAFDQAGAVRRVRSEQVVIDVEVVPASEDKQRWLPAREVQLIESWPEGVDLTAAVIAGEPLTWTLTLIADGLTAAQLPEITPVMPDGLKAYPDQPKLLNDKKQNTLIGVRQEKIALIPMQAGEYLLPAVEVPWWNSVSGKREVARLPARTLQVNAASGAVVAVALDSITEQPAMVASPAAALEQRDNRWRIISVVLGLGWLLTITAWLFHSRRRTVDEKGRSVLERPSPDLNAAQKAVQLACRNNDLSATKAALLAWGRVRWPAVPPGSLAELAQRVSEPLQDEVSQLNKRLYSRLGKAEDGGWDGAQMWHCFTEEMRLQKRKPVKEHSTLAPMYP